MNRIKTDIWKMLEHVDSFRMQSGLFKTFRADYSPETCPFDYINESSARVIETRYDHAFMTEIIMRLEKHFSSREFFLDVIRKSITPIKNAAVAATVNGADVVQWRHYDMKHADGRFILPEIDNTGRCLTALLEYGKVGRDTLIESIISNENNYRQFSSVMSPLNKEFKHAESGEHSAMMTYFGDKPDNDVDPVCNIAAITPVLIFMNEKKYNFDFVGDVGDYLNAFIMSDYASEPFEYYESPVFFYAYSKLIEMCKKQLKPKLSSLVVFGDTSERLLELVLNNIKSNGWKNPFEAAMLVTSMLALGHNGREVDNGIDMIMHNRRADGLWDAYRFYRQRHPHRIFGSSGLSTFICLEALHYYFN